MALSIHLFLKKEKRVPHLPRLHGGPGNKQIGVGKRERGGYEPSPVAVPGPPIPSFPFARPGEVRWRSDLSNEVK